MGFVSGVVLDGGRAGLDLCVCVWRGYNGCVSDDSDGRRQRAQTRSACEGRIGGMELLRGPQVVASTPSQRVAQVRIATMIGWELSGKPMPSYRRCDAPGRVVRAATR